MRATLIAPNLDYPRVLTKGNDGAELVPQEPTHFLLELDEVGDLTRARLTVESLGWSKRYLL